MQYDKQVQVLSKKLPSQIHRLFTNATEQTWLWLSMYVFLTVKKRVNSILQTLVSAQLGLIMRESGISKVEC